MKKDCVHQGKCYAHGSTVHLTGESIVCNNGTWDKQPDISNPGLTIAPGKDLSDI